MPSNNWVLRFSHICLQFSTSWFLRTPCELTSKSNGNCCGHLEFGVFLRSGLGMGNVNLEHANSDVTQIKWECGMLLLEEQDWSFLELPCTILPKSQPPEGPLRSSHVQNAKARFIQCALQPGWGLVPYSSQCSRKVSPLIIWGWRYIGKNCKPGSF